MFLLSGVARYLFLPLAKAVVFAMLASYVLSRTIVPTMAKYLLRHQKAVEGNASSRNPLVRFQRWFEAGFERFRGQTMRSSYLGLLVGLVFAIFLDYLLIVVNFQSWLDPFIMISALPAALAGIAWMLFITKTTLSVPALMGAIMCMGVATAN